MTLGGTSAFVGAIAGVVAGFAGRSLWGLFVGLCRRAIQRKRFRARCLIVGATALTYVDKDPLFAAKLSEILARTVQMPDRKLVADLIGGRARVAVPSDLPPTMTGSLFSKLLRRNSVNQDQSQQLEDGADSELKEPVTVATVQPARRSSPLRQSH